MFSGWIKGAFRGGKKEMEESIQQKLNFVLSTAPMWDRSVDIYALKVYFVCCTYISVKKLGKYKQETII